MKDGNHILITRRPYTEKDVCQVYNPHNKTCWYCGSKDMLDMGDYVKCSGCGATYNDLPRPGLPILEEESVELAAGPFKRTIKKYKPTKSLVRRQRFKNLT